MSGLKGALRGASEKFNDLNINEKTKGIYLASLLDDTIRKSEEKKKEEEQKVANTGEELDLTPLAQDIQKEMEL